MQTSTLTHNVFGMNKLVIVATAALTMFCLSSSAYAQGWYREPGSQQNYHSPYQQPVQPQFHGGGFNYQQWGQTMHDLGRIQGMSQQRLQNTMNELHRLQAQQQNRKRLTTQDILNQMKRNEPININAGTQSRSKPATRPSNSNSGMSRAEWEQYMKQRRERDRINGRGGPVLNDLQQGIGRGVRQGKKAGGYIHNTAKRWGVIR